MASGKTPKTSKWNELVAMASDHAGFAYKSALIPKLEEQGYEITDLGVFSEEPADYPDLAAKMAEALRSGRARRGILICGSGVGVSVAANKFSGIRAGICHDCYSAHQGVSHDDINVLCLGSRVLGFELAWEIIKTFLKARFGGKERHKRRLEKLDAIERANMKNNE